MGQNFKRILQLPDLHKQTVFLWGPRKTGKSSWIRDNIKDAAYIDLLKSDVFAEYAARPSLLRERFKSATDRSPIVIDEIQKCPALLDEVHWLIENSSRHFLLTGSSARKLRRQHANLLGGRAWRREMRPLCYAENKEMQLERAIINGLLPAHYLSENPREELSAYVSDYLKEEIVQEAGVQNLPAFSDFLRVAAITSGELLNYSNVSREVGVSAKVIRSYFQILEDTLLGFRIQPWSKSKTRRMVETEKFYLFDVGVSNFLAKRSPQPKTPEFGKSFEHFILMELLAYKAYRKPELDIAFWRTLDKKEVDFIINDKELVLEIKSATLTSNHDLMNLRILSEDGPIKTRVLVSDERQMRVVTDPYGEIEIYPWREFLDKLWADGFSLS
jgi:predicted AAA+ superfamily ATPase